MPQKLLTLFILSLFSLGACGTNTIEDATIDNDSGLQQAEDGSWSEITEPTSEEVYSDFEPYIREDGAQGTQDNPYNVGEKATTKVGYWDRDLNKHEAMIEIEIETLVTGVEAEEPGYEAPDRTQRVLAVTNVKMIEGSETHPYSISLQPLVYNDEMYIAQETGVNNALVFGDAITLGESQEGTIKMLAPEGDLTGESFVLNTGVDQVWFSF